MAKFLILLALAFVAQALRAQTPEQEINEQVWLPFLKASADFDHETFLSLQSKELVRIGIDQNIVEDYAQYADGIERGFQRMKSDGRISRTAEMRFLSRLNSGSRAYETGYFKSITRLATGEIRTRYTQFSIVLRKENDRWKILVDADTSMNGTITEAMFMAAKPLEQ